MAISANTVFEVRTGGSDTNGGGFVTGASGTDWSQQNAAQYSVTDGVTAGTTTITSATANFGTDVVGNIMYVQGGTGSVTAGWYQITVRNSATSVTVDRSTGLTAGIGVTLKIGGALATPGQAAPLASVSGNKIWVKSGTYTTTTSTAGAGGPVVAASVTHWMMEGYETTRGDRTGTRPILLWGASAPGGTSYLFSANGGNHHSFLNMTADANDVSNVSGFNFSNAGSATSVVENCVAQNCSAASQIGYNMATAAVTVTSCYALDCTTGFSGTTSRVNNCRAKTCTTGFICFTVDCIAISCTTDGFKSSSNPGIHIRGTAYGTSSGDGFDHGNTSVAYVDCVSVGNSAYGFNGVSSNTGIMFNCAHYNNTSGGVNGTPYREFNTIALTGDPFVDAASGDFRPNNTSGAGASLRNAALDTNAQTDNRDIGAVQHSDPAASSSSTIRTSDMNGGLNN